MLLPLFTKFLIILHPFIKMQTSSGRGEPSSFRPAVFNPSPCLRCKLPHANTPNFHPCPLPFIVPPCHRGDRYASVMAAWRASHVNDSSGTGVEWWSSVAGLINFQSGLQDSHPATPPRHPTRYHHFPRITPRNSPITLSVNNMPIKWMLAQLRGFVCTWVSSLIFISVREAYLLAHTL